MSSFLNIVVLALVACGNLVLASPEPAITAGVQEQQLIRIYSSPEPVATRTILEVTKSVKVIEPTRIYRREAVPASLTPVPYTSLPVPTPVCSMSICADYINKCGQMYGGCFLAPECGGVWPSFTPPPCPVTTSTRSAISSRCNGRICEDYFDSCGQTYGGCYLAPSCGGVRPTFTTPPCPPIVTTTATTRSSTTSRCSMSICADYINSCGQMYGGCFLATQCGGTWPSFTPPPCSSTRTTSITTTTIISTTKVITETPTFCSATSTICTDRYNPCTPHQIGTCYLNPKCGGQTLPPVDTSCLATKTTTTSSTTRCSYSVCADYINTCSRMYGGCFLAPECGGVWPSFTPPPCPATPTYVTATPTMIVPPPLKAWQQCGGIGFPTSLGTLCEAGYKCHIYNPYYSQCIPV